MEPACCDTLKEGEKTTLFYPMLLDFRKVPRLRPCVLSARAACRISMEHAWNDTELLRANPCPSATLPISNLTWNDLVWKRASVGRVRRQTAWAMQRLLFEGKLSYIIYTNIKIQSVPLSKHTPVSFIKQTSRLMLYREIHAVCSYIHTKHINTLCGQKVELMNVKLMVHIVTTGLQRVKSRL